MEAGLHQKTGYDSHSLSRHLNVGDKVCLSIPTAGKLDPRWEGKWRIKRIKSPVNVEGTDESRVRVVHINRIQHRLQPDDTEVSPHSKEIEVPSSWNPSQIEHTFQSNEDMWIMMPQWKTRTKHVTQCDRDDFETDMEYTYVMIMDKLNSRRGVCSIG